MAHPVKPGGSKTKTRLPLPDDDDESFDDEPRRLTSTHKFASRRSSHSSDSGQSIDIPIAKMNSSVHDSEPSRQASVSDTSHRPCNRYGFFIDSKDADIE